MLVQCTSVTDQFGECHTVPLTSFEADVCADIGPDSLVILPDDRLAVFFRNGTTVRFGLCPPLPALCSNFTSIAVDSDPLEQGVLSHAVGLFRGMPVLAYSVATYLRILFCTTMDCTGPARVESPTLPLSAQGVAFAAEGEKLILGVANEQGLWLVDCSNSPADFCFAPRKLSNSTDFAQVCVYCACVRVL